MTLKLAHPLDHVLQVHLHVQPTHASIFIDIHFLHIPLHLFSLFSHSFCIRFFLRMLPSSFQSAVLHTVEFQKRGLPHAHIILWTSADTSNPTPTMIDSYVSAEIPDPKLDPLGYALVAEHMVHGPCGNDNPKCPCMKNTKCSKHFPKS